MEDGGGKVDKEKPPVYPSPDAIPTKSKTIVIHPIPLYEEDPHLERKNSVEKRCKKCDCAFGTMVVAGIVIFIILPLIIVSIILMIAITASSLDSTNQNKKSMPEGRVLWS